MSRRDVLRLAWANLNRMRARVALTAIGVIIGTAAVIILISLGVGLQTSTEQQFSEIGDLTVITVQNFGSFGPPGLDTGDEAVLDEAALEEIRQLEHVVAVTPLVSLQGGAELKLGRVEGFGMVQGIDPGALEALDWELESGGLRLGRGQLLIGSEVFSEDGGGFGMVAVGPGGRSRGGSRRGGGGGFAEEAGADRGAALPPDLVGRSVTMRLVKYDAEAQEISKSDRMRVVGVLADQNQRRSVYVSLQQADEINRWFTGQRRNPRDGFSEVQVKVDDRASVSDVQAELESRGFNSFSAQQILEGVGRVFLIMQAVLGGVGAIALLVAAFGIANTMTMAIYERTKEIGIMKAIGATNNDVLQVFLAEAAAIGLFGGVVGVSTGWGAGKLIDLFVRTQLLTNQGGPPPETPPPNIVVTPLWLMAFALVFATLVGLISGIYPALRAANMKPLRALRTD